jgi:hypothetical protein
MVTSEADCDCLKAHHFRGHLRSPESETPSNPSLVLLPNRLTSAKLHFLEVSDPNISPVNTLSTTLPSTANNPGLFCVVMGDRAIFNEDEHDVDFE